jgi:hypothetical protein
VRQFALYGPNGVSKGSPASRGFVSGSGHAPARPSVTSSRQI